MELSLRYTLVALVVLAMLLLGLWLVPKWQVRALKNLTDVERFKLQNEARKLMAEILGGALVLVGLFFSWQTIKSTSQNLKISQEGQITERLTKAVEQLGRGDEDKKPSNLAIRLGGIYGLERIASDSEQDYWPIIELLTAYLKQNALWDNKSSDENLNEIPDPGLDIQAVLTALGRRKYSFEAGEDKQLQLGGTNLRRANLNGGNFKGVNFTLAHLELARMTGTHLEDSDLRFADLRGATLDQAYLTRANLCGADLRGVIGLTADQINSAITDSSTRLP